MTEYSPYVPEDFDEFWNETVAEAHAQPVEFQRTWRNDFHLPGFTVETFTFSGMGGRTLNGWIAYPPGARHLPGFLWVPPYGRESLLPNQYGTRDGFVSLSINFFGEDALHQEKYRVERGYFAEGAGDPHSWVFRRMFQDAYIALRVLQQQHEADESRVGAMGMSQGAGISIWLGSWAPMVRAVCADMPFLCAINHTLTQEVYRYPLKELRDFMETIPLGEQRVLNTLAYFDTMNQATRCKVPTQVSYGLKDPACRPANVRSAYEALTCEKRLIEYDWGHDWLPDMVENNREWLLRTLG